jgi:hypothetical protein
MTEPNPTNKEKEATLALPARPSVVEAEIVERSEGSLVEKQMAGLDRQLAVYLGALGLPTAGVLVSVPPNFPQEQRAFSDVNGPF